MKLVEKVVQVEAPPEIVFGLLTDGTQLVRWMAETADVDARVGGTIRWTHANGDSCAGQFVELVPARRIVFTYGWVRPEVEIPPGSTTVEISLEPHRGGTKLRLVHRGLAGLMADAHSGGWTQYLRRLAEVAAGRDPGPDPFGDQRVPIAAELDG